MGFMLPIIVPVLSTVWPWIVYAETANQRGAGAGYLAAVLPLIGIAAPVVYARIARDWRALVPLVPFAIVVLAEVTTGFIIAANYGHTDVLEGTTKWFSLVELICVLSMPAGLLLALVGGIAADRRADRAPSLP